MRSHVSKLGERAPASSSRYSPTLTPSRHAAYIRSCPLPAYDEPVDQPGDLEPVVLRIERRTRIASISLLAVGSAVLFVVGLLTEGETRSRVFLFSGACLAAVIVVLVEWARAGTAGLEVRLDTVGIAIGRRGIPWEAVPSARWSSSAIHKGKVWKPGIVLHLRDVEGYKAPRSATESVDHLAFRVPANVLLDAIVRYAHPHTVHVIAVDPDEPWPISQSPSVY
jgi:hypothetical protein